MWKAVVVVVCLGLGVFADSPKQSELSAKALQFFAQLEDANFEAYLKRVRPPQVSAEFKAQALAQLTKADTVKRTETMQPALAALAPILQYHERAGVLDIQVIRTREAFVGLQGRAVLLLSENIFRVLSTAELQAVVAHELGHEYFWGELMLARRQKNYDRMREIELRCDGIAVIALERLGLDAKSLISALTAMDAFNRMNSTPDRWLYPENQERFAFIRAMCNLVQTQETRLIAHN